jgi:hypothetical protein
MPLILETVVTTMDERGGCHIVPFGLTAHGGDFVIAPFRPSPTIANLERHPWLSAAAPVDIRVIAGAVTGRRQWTTARCEKIDCLRLAECYAHMELEVREVLADDTRPRFLCRIVHTAQHRPFVGYNRAQAAVIEAAILATRLNMLPPAKIRAEMEYLAIAVSKTAGPSELEAWSWIKERVDTALDSDPEARSLRG